MAFADDLLRDAHHLADRGGRHPRQSSLRRLVSTAYYALFHLLIADFVSDWKGVDQRPKLGRMFDHGKMKQASQQIQNKSGATPVETRLAMIAAAFTRLQEDRNTADYDVSRHWTRTEVNDSLKTADEAFEVWRTIRKEKVARNYLMSMFGAKR